MWNMIKFYLGMKCVVSINNKWYITRTNFLSREMMSNSENYWWCSEDLWEKHCSFKTKEEALSNINKYDIKF